MADEVKKVEQTAPTAAGEGKAFKNERNAAIYELIEKQVESSQTRDYLEKRIVPQMEYYSKKSGECKKRYIQLSTASIVLGALIPVASVFSGGPIGMTVLIAALGSAVTAVNAYLNLQNYKDLWTTYRNTRETLLRTIYDYCYNAGSFAKKEETAVKDRRLIDFCENELAHENGSWQTIVQDTSST